MDAKTWDVGLPRDFAMVTSACTEAKEGLISATSSLLMLFVSTAVGAAVLMYQNGNGQHSNILCREPNRPQLQGMQAIAKVIHSKSSSSTATEPDCFRRWAAPRRGRAAFHLGCGEGRHVVLQPLYLYEVLWAQDIHARGDGLRHLQARESTIHHKPSCSC